MSKEWTQLEPRTGKAIAPDEVNVELRTAAESIQSLDRTQLPALSVNASNLETYALHRVWAKDRWPTTAGQQGEQGAVRDAATSTNSWEAVTYQEFGGGWQTLAASFDLTGFKGGNLFIEWAGVGFIFPMFSDTLNQPKPGNPKYLRFRILVAGVVVAEVRGCAYHESFRLFGTAQLPAGDHEVLLQFKPTSVGADDPLTDTGGDPILQAHVYGNKVFSIGRFR